MNDFRTEAGGRIDRSRPLHFTFDGRAFKGFAGDTLASALIANGIHLVGRSFKYHRPRGILSAGAEEPNALVHVDRGGRRETPNLRATTIELYDGLAATSQNRFPSLAFDLGEAANYLSPLIPAGFYYKSFMWPRSFWRHIYEPVIRRSAGLGRAPKSADPDRYLHRYAHCDVLVVGGGPAGLAAAIAASEDGARVILCDEQAEFGGALLHEAHGRIAGQSAADLVAEAVATLSGRDNVRLLPRTTAFGYYADNLVCLAERVTDHLAEPDPDLPRERIWQLRAKEVILATGAIERPLVFPENDRPGVMLADAASAYLHRYGVKAGKRAVIVTAHDSAYRTALDLYAEGVEIVAIADLRATPEGEAIEKARAAGLPVMPSTTINGTLGRLRVRAVDLGFIGEDGKVDGGDRVNCDLVLMAGGFTPSVHLFSQSRGRLLFDAGLNAFVPGEPAQRQQSVGAAAGTFDSEACLGDGFAAGEIAARLARGEVVSRLWPMREDGRHAGYAGLAPSQRNERGVKAFVDFQNDVTAKDLKLAAREGFRAIEHVKRYTTTGMATDQGKTSNINALAIVADTLGKPVLEVGLTTFRPPYTPVTFGAIAGASRGDLFDPVRKTPIHDWAAEKGAAFEDVGLWKRAWYFPRSGEDMHQAVARECKAVRESVGIFDASTLGKIEVVGPDAAEFMNRLYINSWTKLEPGRCRYGVMLTEAGFIMDDGVIGRLAPDRFHVTTTTGGAPRVLHHMEDYLQTEFPELKVWLTSTTEQWAVIAVQGKHARDLIEPLVYGFDMSAEAMPHMSVRTGKIAGVPTRLFRVSFSGELGYEINVPSSAGREIWEKVYASGERFGITPYGTETMHVLRAEKGYIIVGQETDGTVTPDDVGLSGMVGKAKPDFVGKRSLTRPDFVKANRKQLVGLKAVDPKVVLEEGAQVVTDPHVKMPVPMIGHVTSSYWSESLQRGIALALVAGGRARMGETLYVPMPKQLIAVEVVDPVFVDKEGTRLNG
jgi:sarcosine oxidase subunit alpha